ncbi:MAG: L,D-transpeptidase [Amphritea sp.]
MYLTLSISKQVLCLFKEERCIREFQVSTALNGAGEQKNSGKTPRGRHYIRAKVGADQPLNAVFVGRRFSGEIYSPQLAAQHPGRDWILTRILWLCGSELGRNRLGNVDSMQRYIYIHGTPETEPMGLPRSHGCIRMRNPELLELFDLVPVGTPIQINE